MISFKAIKARSAVTLPLALALSLWSAAACSTKSPNVQATQQDTQQEMQRETQRETRQTTNVFMSNEEDWLAFRNPPLVAGCGVQAEQLRHGGHQFPRKVKLSFKPNSNRGMFSAFMEPGATFTLTSSSKFSDLYLTNLVYKHRDANIVFPEAKISILESNLLLIERKVKNNGTPNHKGKLVTLGNGFNPSDSSKSYLNLVEFRIDVGQEDIEQSPSFELSLNCPKDTVGEPNPSGKIDLAGGEMHCTLMHRYSKDQTIAYASVSLNNNTVESMKFELAKYSRDRIHFPNTMRSCELEYDSVGAAYRCDMNGYSLKYDVKGLTEPFVDKSKYIDPKRFTVYDKAKNFELNNGAAKCKWIKAPAFP